MFGANSSFLLLTFFLISNVFANDVNLYQTCTDAGNNYSEAPGVYWWYNPIGPLSSPDAGDMALPPSEYYSYTLEDGRIVYFNICSGSTICDGGVACVITPNGAKTIYSYPNSAPIYYSNILYNNGIPETIMDVSYHTRIPDYRSVEVRISCDSIQAINSVVFDDDDEERYMTIYMLSPDICMQKQVTTFTPPRNYTSLTAPLFLSGNLPMFSMDSVSYGNEGTTFVGTVMYSTVFNSFKMEGILSNNKGDSSDVAYLYSGNQRSGEPIMVSRITYHEQSEPSCVVLSKPFRKPEDNVVNWFGTDSSHNNFQSLSRNYTSIYFDKGNSFLVHVYSYALDRTDITLIQTQSGAPIFVGVNAMAPFLGFTGEVTPFMISEFDWKSIDTNFLSNNIFDIPTDWNCDIREANPK